MSPTQQQASPAATGVFAAFAAAADDPGQARATAEALVPFGVFAGLRVTALNDDHGTVEIPDEPHLRNHLGTVHAGALYLAADIAGAVAFVGAVLPQIAAVDRFVLRDSHSVYLKPALGRITATATVDERTVRHALHRTDAMRFDLDGRALLHDEQGVLVAKFTFEYAAGMTAPTA